MITYKIYKRYPWTWGRYGLLTNVYKTRLEAEQGAAHGNVNREWWEVLLGARYEVV